MKPSLLLHKLHTLTSRLPRPIGEGVWGVGLLLLVSCSSILDHTDDLGMTPEQNTLMSPNDTIYSVVGTITMLQKVADRTNLLGEVRADLVQCTPDASVYLQNLASYNFDNLGPYNRVADYYAIINNCNYFIGRVDTTFSKRGQSVFKKEYAVMKTYRAWAYLQLAINYGQVPFFTHFLATEADGQRVLQGPKVDVTAICNFFIDDLAPYVDTPLPQYGTIGSWRSEKFFIPVRLMLGELCLWAGRYQEAAQYYNEFLADDDNPRPMSELRAYWRVQGVGDLGRPVGYSFSSSSDENIAVIPMEATEADGTISRLYDIYSSTDENLYFYQLSRSEALTELSANQNYCYVWEHTAINRRDTVIVHRGDTVFENKTMYGDLRLYSNVTEGYTSSSTTSEYSHNYQTVDKIFDDALPFYRLTQVYLHYAEALNRAGFPSAAMMILKYGVCQDYVDEYVTPYERERAGMLLYFPAASFPRVTTSTDASGRPVTVKATYPLHGRGCGDVEADTTYVLPMPDVELASMSDTIQYQIPLVEDMIMDEAALECCFEGTRFGDLVRIALRRADPAYLADRVARRRGTLDASLRQKLMSPAAWYLPL